MLHLITEVGKPGKQERERRHYTGVHNAKSEPHYKARARRYIPHGYGDEWDFRPHPVNKNPTYSENGPDWKSRPRRIPSPHNPSYRPEIWPTPWYSMRTYPHVPAGTHQSDNEWTMYPERQGYDATLRCAFNGVHRATMTTSDEITHTTLYGRGRNGVFIDKRNGISQAAPGDKTYQAVEYSNDFHRQGCTLPLVNFSGNKTVKPDTFVPLQELPRIPRPNYTVKEHHRQLHVEQEDVKGLEKWRPASPLIQSGPPAILEDRTMSQMSRY